ncbi:MAG: FlgD immunoglobulin-like domain containing protein [bacterium]
MKTRYCTWLSLFFALVAALPFSVSAQGVPPDLEIIGNAGGLAPWAENQYLEISANGQAIYERAIAGAIGAPPLEERTFTLSAAEVERLWQVISSNDFFNLSSQFADSSVLDPTFARLVIRANGVTHEVSVQNISIFQFDNIILALNEATPPEADLVYETYYPPLIFETEVCDQFRGLLPEAPRDLLPEKFKRAKPYDNQTTRPQTQSAAAHSGTTVACHISLQDAVAQGLVKLEAKGDFWGDQVSISAKNSPPVKCNSLQITLNLEFYGPNATPANVAHIKSAIESKWNGQTTSDGRKVSMHVNTRRKQGATFPPGTPGFHQVELVGRLAISFVSGDPKVNIGTGGGKWATIGNSLNEMYAHEAGHLMGLPDRYDDYRKQSNGTWRREADGKSFTSEELAKILAPPGQPFDPTKRWLDRRSNMRVASPHPGHHNDLMATLSGKVQKSDIDALVAQAGLVIDVRPGETLVNKKRREQNFVITRGTGIFVLDGGAIRLDGLYAACIDLDKDIPETGGNFDLGPPLNTWAGIESAPALFNLLRYIDENELFCESNDIAQQAIWRITDNAYIGNDAIQNFLQTAGINLGNAFIDFPRMTNPDSTDTTTAVLIPQELLVVQVTPRSTLTSGGQNVNLTGKFLPPAVPDVTITGTSTWHLETPEGSAAQIATPSDSTAAFTTDVRGFYGATLQVHATAVAEDTTSFVVSSTARVVVPDSRTDTFEDGELENAPFNWQTDGGNYWSVTNTTSYTGGFAAEAGFVIDGESAFLEISPLLLTPGKLSFAYKLSAYPDDGFLTFSIDGVPQEVWTGKVDWAHATYELPAGRHTLTWAYRKESLFPIGLEGAWIDDVFFPPDAVFTAVAEKQEIPLQYQLLQNYPNPFNPQTEIRFDLPKPEHVVLKVFDVAGHEVRTVIAKRYAAGKHRVLWDGKDNNGNWVASGVYFYQIRAGNFSQVRKMTLLR